MDTLRLRNNSEPQTIADHRGLAVMEARCPVVTREVIDPPVANCVGSIEQLFAGPLPVLNHDSGVEFFL
jgi:hypothetical protein